jgi:hypothetical protein
MSHGPGTTCLPIVEDALLGRAALFDRHGKIENDRGVRHRSIKRASREQGSARQLRGVRIRGVIREVLV